METQEKIARIEPQQRHRLAYIEFCLFFRGHFKLEDLTGYFRSSRQDCEADLATYQSIAADNIEFDADLRRYFQSNSFAPVFPIDAKTALFKLTKHSPQQFKGASDSHFPVEHSSYINYPDIEIIAALVQAILNGNVVNIIYTSLSSGSGAREIVPHSIIDNGLRWHVRGYDRKSNSFRDFILTRISHANIRSNQISNHERQDVDWQWQDILELEIKAHPNNVEYKTAIEMDYGMIDGSLKLKVRAALAGYLLRRWNVDCSRNATLNSPEFQLYLSNRDRLDGVGNLNIAPGYD